MDWIYGIHTENEIIKYSSENITDFCILDGSKNPRLIELCNQAQKRGIKIRYLNNRDLSELVDGLHQGVAILCKPKPYLKENELLDLVKHYGEKAFILVLDGVTDPHNLGACLRSSLAAGVNAVVIPKARSAGLTPVVRKIACGAAEVIPIAMVPNLRRILLNMKDVGIWTIGASADAKTSLYDTDLSGPLALILGGEEKGLRQLTENHCDVLCKIPMKNNVESLNVSVASGIYLFEALRQRTMTISP